MIKYQKDTSNIVTLTLDMENTRHNIINHEIGRSFLPVLAHLKRELKKGELEGVILTSSKNSFLIGGDLEYLSQAKEAKAVFSFVEKLKEVFRIIETLGVPFVAAINGTALGNGFELALATHYRIAIDKPDTIIGLPEVTLGMMPGGGGLVRLVWMLGIEKATPLLTEGKTLNAKEALAHGLIDELVSDRRDLVKRAKEWILNNRDIQQPWDRKGAKINGKGSKHPSVQRFLGLEATRISARTHRNFPAPLAILDTISEVGLLDFKSASRIESRYFTDLILGQVCKNLTSTFWFDFNTIKSGSSRPKGFGKFRPKRIGIIGSGLMGSGIGFISTLAGLEVVLKDVSIVIAERGKGIIEDLLNKHLIAGKIEEGDLQAALDRIITTESVKDFKDCDLVIEAVYENRQLKNQVTKETEKYIDNYCVFASNTSTIPISSLAKASVNPQNFVGLHFFAPVEKRNLVEIIKAENTSDETIARAFDFVKLIKKTPIVVGDQRGFYITRIAGAYIMEGMAILSEGQKASRIEHAGKQAGMKRGPLEMADDFGLNLIQDIFREMANDLGDDYTPLPGYNLLEKMVNEWERLGKHKKAGFYDYDALGTKTLWPDLTNLIEGDEVQLETKEIEDRLMFIQVIETIRCMEEGVVRTTADANVGSVLGWGFAAHKGGTLQFIQDYGKEKFLDRAKELENKYGNRFELNNPLNIF